jgi:hypothetical protein
MRQRRNAPAGEDEDRPKPISLHTPIFPWEWGD